MPKPIGEPILETLRQGRSRVTLEEAAWLVWPSERRSGVSAAMSSAQFVHFNAPVFAVQQNGRMEYFDENGELGWTSNLAWPRANLEMVRLPARAAFLDEDSSPNNGSSEETGEE